MIPPFDEGDGTNRLSILESLCDLQEFKARLNLNLYPSPLINY
ncbi:hypothetical protein M595_5405 [Lyngbya aestuarii BL J]|uniref:Uncharacterized protein n=1 Tax=Lyngbya aestuarii BL J TaxID=1348334 RepID=U7QD51_9CYAN|nr:hypothetical protein M595_5405 [Lyngbya aestuarii BL J]